MAPISLDNMTIYTFPPPSALKLVQQPRKNIALNNLFGKPHQAAVPNQSTYGSIPGSRACSVDAQERPPEQRAPVAPMRDTISEGTTQFSRGHCAGLDSCVPHPTQVQHKIQAGPISNSGSSPYVETSACASGSSSEPPTLQTTKSDDFSGKSGKVFLGSGQSPDPQSDIAQHYNRPSSKDIYTNSESDPHVPTATANLSIHGLLVPEPNNGASDTKIFDEPAAPVQQAVTSPYISLLAPDPSTHGSILDPKPYSIQPQADVWPQERRGTVSPLYQVGKVSKSIQSHRAELKPDIPGPNQEQGVLAEPSSNSGYSPLDEHLPHKTNRAIELPSMTTDPSPSGKKRPAPEQDDIPVKRRKSDLEAGKSADHRPGVFQYRGDDSRPRALTVNQQRRVSGITKPHQEDQVPTTYLATESVEKEDPFSKIESWYRRTKQPTVFLDDDLEIRSPLPLASSPRQNRQSQAALRSDEDDGQYPVKAIRAKWDEWFLVEWDGEYSEQNWVHSENIHEDLVTEYEGQHPGVDLAGDLTISSAKRRGNRWWFKVLWSYGKRKHGVWVEKKKLDEKLVEKYKSLTADHKLPARRRRI